MPFLIDNGEEALAIDMSARRLSRLLLLVATCALAQTPGPPSRETPQPVGEVYAADASVKGAVVLTGSGTSIMSGSSISAGEAVASLRLARGGEVRICPRTSISVATSPKGHDLMLGMSTGAIEAQYALPSSADSIMTPDFRILLPGPGNFHFSLGADARGNTCLRTMKYDTASLIVTELMGNGTYQVKPGEEVLFRGGKVTDYLSEAGTCGCPAAVPPVVRAEAPKPAPPPTPASLPTSPPSTQQNDVHVEVDAPFVFRATDPVPEIDLTVPIAQLRRSTLPIFAPAVLPPVAVSSLPASQAATASAAPAKPKHGFFGKVKSLFGKIFH